MEEKRESVPTGRRPFIARTLGALASLPLLSACASAMRGEARASEGAGGFDFGVVGDIPYTRAQEAEYARVMQHMNSRELEFVAHIGDMMFDPRPYERNPALARMPATDENYAYVLGTFQTIRHPLVMTPPCVRGDRVVHVDVEAGRLSTRQRPPTLECSRAPPPAADPRRPPQHGGPRASSPRTGRTPATSHHPPTSAGAPSP